MSKKCLRRPCRLWTMDINDTPTGHDLDDEQACAHHTPSPP
jgi:hypothetical protein